MEDNTCRVCGTGMQVDDGKEWPDGFAVCWECLWNERTELLHALKRLIAKCDSAATVGDLFEGTEVSSAVLAVCNATSREEEIQ